MRPNGFIERSSNRKSSPADVAFARELWTAIDDAAGADTSQENWRAPDGRRVLADCCGQDLSTPSREFIDDLRFHSHVFSGWNGRT